MGAGRVSSMLSREQGEEKWKERERKEEGNFTSFLPFHVIFFCYADKFKYIQMFKIFGYKSNRTGYK